MPGRVPIMLKICYLKPGEVLLTAEPSLVTTILGSCLSITMYHKSTKTSVICHAVMPLSARAGDKRKNEFLYVDSSLKWMIDQLSKKRIRMSDVEVKMFGGAAMFTDRGPIRLDINVGKKNVDAALEYLKKHRIHLTAWNVGGSRGRKLIFNTMTGEVLAKFITETEEAQMVQIGGRK